jgi:ribonuclease HI
MMCKIPHGTICNGRNLLDSRRMFYNRRCETIALFEAKKEMEQRDYTRIIFETNSKSVVDAIHNLHVGDS